MKNVLSVIKNDFQNFITYRILHFVLILSFLLAVSMGFFPRIDALNYVYVSVFVLPVIIFAVSLYIENTDEKLLPCLDENCNIMTIVIAKVLSALLLNLIPLTLYLLTMGIILHMHFSFILFILVYILSVVMHIVVGIVLAIISRSSFVMSVSYIGYIVFFSLIPIFYANGLIPEFFQYVLVISPAYLSGLLFENIIYGYIFTQSWLLALSVVLQFVYIFVLTYYVIKPYFQAYLRTIRPVE